MKARIVLTIVIVFSALIIVLGVSAQEGSHLTAASRNSSLNNARWRQVNEDGFGDINNHGITSLSSFKNYLYAGTANDSAGGAQLWRSVDGQTWTVISDNGLGDADNGIISDSIEFKGMLYAGVGSEVDGGKIYRTSNGTVWLQVTLPGFSPTNIEIVRFAVFDGHIYAGTYTGETPTHGAEIWRSSTGNSGDWTRVVSDGFDSDVGNKYIIALYVYNDYLYAGTDNWSGMEIWRTNNGSDWAQVNLDGFGDIFNWSVALEFFKGYLYAGTYNYWNSDNPGCELWRCILCDGTDWEHVASVKGFGDTENRSIRSLEVFKGFLYAVTYNATSGIEVWRTQNGTSWNQINLDGFGDSQNRGPYWDNSVTVFNDNLYVGTRKSTTGGEIWLYLHNTVYLPIAVRNP